MLLINGRKYATSDSEMVDSLFNDGSGTLEKFHKIKHNKNESLFYITEDSGVAICKGRDNGGMLIKFTIIKDCNGKESDAARIAWTYNTQAEAETTATEYFNNYTQGV